MRVVSVLPSATEIVCAVGAGAALVGRSEECDYPAAVRELPVVMRAKTLDLESPSREIDARVRRSLEARESLYTIDLGRLAALRPDLMLTQDLCRVCSVTDEEARTACELAGVSPRILSIAPRSLHDVWESVVRIGEAVGRGDAGRSLSRELEARTARDRGSARDRVLVLEWIDPPIEAGLWTPELIESAGGVPWTSRTNAPAQAVDLEALRSDPPELVVVSPCSFPVTRTARELEGSSLAKTLARLDVPRGVWLADEAHFSRPGPRLTEGRELIANALAGRPPSGRLPVRCWRAPALPARN